MLNVGYYPNLLKKPTSHQTQPSQIKKPFLNENFCGEYLWRIGFRRTWATKSDPRRYIYLLWGLKYYWLRENIHYDVLKIACWEEMSIMRYANQPVWLLLLIYVFPANPDLVGLTILITAWRDVFSGLQWIWDSLR